MNATKALARWHHIVRSGSPAEELATIIHDDAVFHSPVVHTPQIGRGKVILYLSAAGKTLGNAHFTYVRELVDGDTAMLEFTTLLDDIHINGVDIIRFDEQGMITDFKVMLRPLKAVNKVWEMMAAQLQKQGSASN